MRNERENAFVETARAFDPQTLVFVGGTKISLPRRPVAVEAGPLRQRQRLPTHSILFALSLDGILAVSFNECAQDTLRGARRWARGLGRQAECRYQELRSFLVRVASALQPASAIVLDSSCICERVKFDLQEYFDSR